MEAIYYENKLNQNLSTGSNRMKSKQQITNIRLRNENIMKCHEYFNRKKSNALDCQVYLYEELEAYPTPQQALVFHFKHSFDITIEGIVVEGKITNLEFIGLPEAPGKYYILTPKCIKCIPDKVISCSKQNKFNDTGILNSRDWNFQTLALLGLDELVQNISQQSYAATDPPRIEPPPETVSDMIKYKASGLCSYFRGDDLAAKDKKLKQKKEPVELPQITVPHVPSEYDGKVRDAVVIRYNKGEEWSLIFHFQGDDSFRTIKGVWNENTLKPSMLKQRPTGAGGTFMELGVIEISPQQVREIVLENKFNGANINSDITEIDWAKQICRRIGLYEHWNGGSPWRYFQPPQYTVAPDINVFTVPFKLPTS